MGLFEGCLLACDVDGTLMFNGNINPKNIEKIEFFINEGGKFSICSGRSVGALLHIVKKLKKVSSSVTGNGVLIYDFENKQIISQKVLPKSDYRIVKKILENDLDVGIEIHTGLELLSVKKTEESTAHQVYEKLVTVDATFEEALSYDWNKVLFSCKSKEQQAYLKKMLEKEKTDCDFITTCAAIDGVTYYYLEQLPSGISKIAGIKELCEIFSIGKGRLFAIGDYYNDLEMLQNADISAVPNDSPEDVKCYGDYLTVSCDNGAVADFIDYLTAKAEQKI